MQNNKDTGVPKMSENRDSFEFSVGATGFTLRAQGKVTALLSAMMSIGALTVAAYFAQEAFIPIMKKRMRVEDGEEPPRSLKYHTESEDEEDRSAERPRTRVRRSAPAPNDESVVGQAQVKNINIDAQLFEERKRPVYVAAGISLIAVVTSIYFGRKAWMNLGGRITRLPRSE